MFQFPGFAFRLLGISRSLGMGCPIRKSADQRLFAPPHSLSQLITSFFAFESLGIPHTLLVTFFARLLVLSNINFISFVIWLYSQHVKELFLQPPLYTIPLLKLAPSVSRHNSMLRWHSTHPLGWSPKCQYLGNRTPIFLWSLILKSWPLSLNH